MTEKKSKELFEKAKAASQKAYAPYSGFSVGAALLCDDGTVFDGANIETAAYVTNCAERTAFYTAIFNGHRDFSAIAVYGKSQKGGEEKECYPCGVCRQIMAEFCSGDFEIIVGDAKGDPIIKTLDEILPFRFGKENL